MLIIDKVVANTVYRPEFIYNCNLSHYYFIRLVFYIKKSLLIISVRCARYAIDI